MFQGEKEESKRRAKKIICEARTTSFPDSHIDSSPFSILATHSKMIGTRPGQKAFWALSSRKK